MLTRYSIIVAVIILAGLGLVSWATPPHDPHSLSGLETIPADLLEAIGRRLSSPSDLIALSATCKAVASAVANQIADRRFRALIGAYRYDPDLVERLQADGYLRGPNPSLTDDELVLLYDRTGGAFDAASHADTLDLMPSALRRRHARISSWLSAAGRHRFVPVDETVLDRLRRVNVPETVLDRLRVLNNVLDGASLDTTQVVRTFRQSGQAALLRRRPVVLALLQSGWRLRLDHLLTATDDDDPCDGRELVLDLFPLLDTFWVRSADLNDPLWAFLQYDLRERATADLAWTLAPVLDHVRSRLAHLVRTLDAARWLDLVRAQFPFLDELCTVPYNAAGDTLLHRVCRSTDSVALLDRIVPDPVDVARDGQTPPPPPLDWNVRNAFGRGPLQYLCKARLVQLERRGLDVRSVLGADRATAQLLFGGGEAAPTSIWALIQEAVPELRHLDVVGDDVHAAPSFTDQDRGRALDYMHRKRPGVPALAGGHSVLHYALAADVRGSAQLVVNTVKRCVGQFDLRVEAAGPESDEEAGAHRPDGIHQSVTAFVIPERLSRRYRSDRRQSVSVRGLR